MSMEHELTGSDIPSVSPSPSQSPEKPKLTALPKGKAKPVIVYGVVMFAAAILLLLISFLMQQRNHQALMEGLSSSMLNAQSVVELQIENQTLTDQIQALEAEKNALEEQRQKLQDSMTQTEQQRDAVDWLRSIVACYAARDYETAKNRIVQFQQLGLEDALPTTSSVENMLSPAEQYEKILTALQ